MVTSDGASKSSAMDGVRTRTNPARPSPARSSISSRCESANRREDARAEPTFREGRSAGVRRTRGRLADSSATISGEDFFSGVDGAEAMARTRGVRRLADPVGVGPRVARPGNLFRGSVSRRRRRGSRSDPNCTPARAAPPLCPRRPGPRRREKDAGTACVSRVVVTMRTRGRRAALLHECLAGESTRLVGCPAEPDRLPGRGRRGRRRWRRRRRRPPPDDAVVRPLAPGGVARRARRRVGDQRARPRRARARRPSGDERRRGRRGGCPARAPGATVPGVRGGKKMRRFGVLHTVADGEDGSSSSARAWVVAWTPASA